MLQTLLQILADGWGTAIIRGAVTTILVAAAGMLLGTVFGMLGAVCKRSTVRPLVLIVGAYTTVVRSVPELLLVYLFFFGSIESGTAIAAAFGYQDGFNRIYPMLVGILAIAVISGSYSVEVFRGAMKAIAIGQIEAAHAIGMSRWACLRRIVLPQMLWYALPGTSNVWQAALKDTALVSVIGLPEVMRVSVLGAASMREPLAFYLIAGVVYFAIAVISQVIFRRAERSLGRGLGGK